MILTYNEMLEAISDGEDDWRTLTCRLPRNSLPMALSTVLAEFGPDHLSDDQLAEAAMTAWVMCEYPENALPRDEWLGIFGMLGYRHNTAPVEPPAEVVLWRGGIDPDRMSWTADRDLAEWFRNRYDGGQLWTATVPAASLLAYYDRVRVGGVGPGESEYVINPAGVRYSIV